MAEGSSRWPSTTRRSCDDVDALVGPSQHVHGLFFGPPNPDLGQARVATQSDGTVVGIRKPPAAHEGAIMRTYLESKTSNKQQLEPRRPGRLSVTAEASEDPASALDPEAATGRLTAGGSGLSGIASPRLVARGVVALDGQ